MYFYTRNSETDAQTWQRQSLSSPLHNLKPPQSTHTTSGSPSSSSVAPSHEKMATFTPLRDRRSPKSREVPKISALPARSCSKPKAGGLKGITKVHCVNEKKCRAWRQARDVLLFRSSREATACCLCVKPNLGKARADAWVSFSALTRYSPEKLRWLSI